MKVKIVEVGVRDGLQNEKQILPTEQKLELIQRLQLAGLQTIEVGAFVSPKWVPQMADTAALLEKLHLQSSQLHYPVLVPNLKGLELAIKSGVHEIAITAAASDTFLQKNINQTIDESLKQFQTICQEAHKNHIRVRGYLSCMVDCPYEGKTAPEKVAHIAHALLEMGCYEISLGDTIGRASPNQILTVLEKVSQKVPINRLAGHYHNTYGMALANIYASLEWGIRTFDTSVGGLGGCPYAKGASGNVPTEEVVNMLHEMGFETDISLPALLDAALFVSTALSKPLPSRVYQAWRGLLS